MDTLATYLVKSPGPRLVYLALWVEGPRKGQVLTWSTSKRVTKEDIAKQWEPATLRVLKVSLA